MAKTYVDIVKYMVEARFEISGLVDKPDIIGAVFGQTEGLLGSDLDLRELQKNGKIGRIEIDTQTSGSKTIGKLHLPSSLGRVETCILAAAIESVDRVGPFETNFKVDKVEDTRSEKRNKIVRRAKELVKLLLTTEIPDSREISDMVESDVKSSVVTTYGPEGLAAGPDIDKNSDIILVEGRADVINLLKNDMPNCIAVGGASGAIPKTIVDLCNAKETTLFLDGDRGGDIILRGLMNVAEIDFVARAPDGKEVEELQRKEIIKAMRSRVPIEQLFPNLKNGSGHKPNTDQGQHPQPQQQRPPQNFRDRERPQPRPVAPQHNMAQQQQQPQQQQPQQTRSGPPQPLLSPSDISSNLLNKPQPRSISSIKDEVEGDLNIKDIRGDSDDDGNPVGGIPYIQPKISSSGPSSAPPKYKGALDELHNTLRGRLYDTNGGMMTEVPIRELIQAVQDSKNIDAIVFDGIITQRLIELANSFGVKEIYGIRASQITRKYDGMLLYTKEKGVL